jgi:uncharacterized protein (DUF1330 family)
MPAYLLANVEITDPEGYEEYRRRVPAIITAYGGRYLARGGTVERLEGDTTPQRVVVVEFPSLKSLKAFYESPEYRPIIAIRQRTSRSHLIAVEGV